MENESPVEDFEEDRVVRTELEAALRTSRKTRVAALRVNFIR
jgi:hypothetical protein